jgi:hypothetical protein
MMIFVNRSSIVAISPFFIAIPFILF